MPAVRSFRVAQSPPRVEIEGNWMPVGQPAVLLRSDLPANVNTKQEIENYINNTWLPSICAGRCTARLTVDAINGPNDIVWTLEIQ